MPRRRKIRETEVRLQQSSKIEIDIDKIPEGTSFSFRYYQNDRDKFSISKRDIGYFLALLERLRNLSRLTVKEIINNQTKSLRCHPIDWNDTTEPNGFGIPNEEKIVYTAYQFQISANEHGRVHGFFRDNVFYIVWLDPDHNLYA